MIKYIVCGHFSGRRKLTYELLLESKNLMNISNRWHPLILQSIQKKCLQHIQAALVETYVHRVPLISSFACKSKYRFVELPF